MYFLYRISFICFSKSIKIIKRQTYSKNFIDFVIRMWLCCKCMVRNITLLINTTYKFPLIFIDCYKIFKIYLSIYRTILKHKLNKLNI